MTSLRYKNPSLNRRRKLLDKDKKERRTAHERREAEKISEYKETIRLQRLQELEEEIDGTND